MVSNNPVEHYLRYNQPLYISAHREHVFKAALDVLCDASSPKVSPLLINNLFGLLSLHVKSSPLFEPIWTAEMEKEI